MYVSIYAASSGGYSKLSLSRALRRYISLPIASDQSAQLVPGLGGDIQTPQQALLSEARLPKDPRTVHPKAIQFHECATLVEQHPCPDRYLGMNQDPA